MKNKRLIKKIIQILRFAASQLEEYLKECEKEEELNTFKK